MNFIPPLTLAREFRNINFLCFFTLFKFLVLSFVKTAMRDLPPEYGFFMKNISIVKIRFLTF